jgi:hypothetical protein
MKRKVLTVVLAMTVFMAMSFAGVESAFAASSTPAASKLATKLATTSTVIPVTVIDGTQITPVSLNSSTEKPYFTPTYPSVTQSKSLTYPIVVSSPSTVAITYASVNCSASFGLYNSSNSNSITGNDYATYTNGAKVTTYPITTAGTYYLHVYLSSFSSDGYAKFEVQSAPFGGTLTSGKTYCGAGKTSSSVSYYKIQVPATGYLKIQSKSALGLSDGSNIKFLNSSKKSLFSGYEYLGSDNGYTTNIGVRKGTYYIALKSPAGIYALTATFNKVAASKHGTKKSNAVYIKKTGTKKGIMAITSGATDWYKIKVTKTQTVNIIVKTKASTSGNYSGGIKVSVYSNKYSMGSATYNSSRSGSTLKLYTYGKGGKLTPGTYYIKVSRYYKGSGYYTLKWK